MGKVKEECIKQQVSSFRNYLSSFKVLNDEEWEAFQSKMSYFEFEKGNLLTQAGKVENYVYFIIKGFVRVFVPSQGNEFCTNFRFEKEFTSSVTSFISRLPSQHSLEALSDVEALGMQYDDVQELYDNYPAINTIGRKIIEGLFIEKHYRELEFLTKNAEERYQNLFERFPRFVEKISGKNIASYLGVTPETLSRIRHSG